MIPTPGKRPTDYKLMATTLLGTATAGAAATITLAVGSSATNDHYIGWKITLTGGTGAGQVRTVTDYVGGTRRCTVAAWDDSPDNTTTYSLEGGPSLWRDYYRALPAVRKAELKTFRKARRRADTGALKGNPQVLWNAWISQLSDALS